MGLWIKCTMFMTGNWDCDDYDRIILGLPARLQAGNFYVQKWLLNNSNNYL